jgi:hypothetical protein
MTPWCWVIGTGMMMVRHRETFARAASFGLVGAIGGLISWAAYHAISRRNDGFGAFIVGFSVAFLPGWDPASPLSHELARCVFTLTPVVLMHCVVGLLLRDRRKARASPPWGTDRMASKIEEPTA